MTAARDAGMHLAFFSGNEVFWRTRWERDANGASHRTLVVYKVSTGTGVVQTVSTWHWVGAHGWCVVDISRIR